MTSPESRGPLTWAALIGLGVALETVALRQQRQDSTLSHATRSLFRTETNIGKAMFVGAWTSLTLWFVPHIIRSISDSVTNPGGEA